MCYMCKGHIYSLCQNLSLNLNSMNQKEEISLYCSKLDISLIDMLNKGDIEIKKAVCSQYEGILKSFIYRLILICNFLKDS